MQQLFAINSKNWKEIRILKTKKSIRSEHKLLIFFAKNNSPEYNRVRIILYLKKEKWKS